MDYQNYEDYMRSVLGYQSGNIYANTYNPRNDYYYDMPMMTQMPDYTINETDEFTELYPEIYKLLYPMVCKVCSQNRSREITKDLIDKMTDEIYVNFESEDTQGTNMRAPLKNGDVRNPNAKEPETRQDTRQRNFLLRDLIKILILKELWRHERRPNRPPFPPPVRPPMPSRPPIMGPDNSPFFRP